MYEGEGEAQESVSVVGVLESSASDMASETEVEQFSIGYGAVNLAADIAVAKQRVTTQYNGMAAPPDVLAFARQLGLEGVLKSKAYGVLTKKDLAQLYERQQQKPQVTDSGRHQDSGSDTVIRLNAAKKVMAQTMTKSHQHVPAVTLFDDASVDAWFVSRKLKEDTTVRLIQAIVKGAEQVPIMNAWFDEENLSIQTFSDINIGIAVNSEEGLFVPVIRKAQNLSASNIRSYLDKMIDDVGTRMIKPQKLLGATISLSNFGTLSGRYATPIVVPPQVAILGVGKIRQQAVVKDGQLAAGKVLPVSLSFDHRAATGAEAAAFLKALIEDIEKSGA